MNYFIDSHCHLHEPWFTHVKIQEIIIEAEYANVNKIVNCASDPKLFKFVLETYIHDKLFITLGIQPTEAPEFSNANVIETKLAKKENRHKIKAIGEVGLDYYWVKDISFQKRQKKLFLDAISLANEWELPIVIHSRKAEKDCLDLLEQHAQTSVLLHSFEGNHELIQRTKDLGYLISIPTNVVIRKNRRKIAVRAGLQQIVLETDSPYCSPFQDGFPNTPKNITIAARKLAELFEIDVNEIRTISTSNAEKFYKL